MYIEYIDIITKKYIFFVIMFKHFININKMFTISTINDLTDVNYDIYVLSYNNHEREQNMIRRLKQVGTTANICTFLENDKRCQEAADNGYQRLHQLKCFFNHLAMMEEFVNNSSKEYGIFLENDIYLRKTLTKDLIIVTDNMKKLDLDVLLIGYLINDKPESFGCKHYHTDEDNNKYYRYGSDLWGTQGFILTKAQAKHYINKYTVKYILSSDEVISADWIYTKQGNKSLLYPPLVVEEGSVNCTDQPQIRFHASCNSFLYNTSYTD